MKLTEMRDAQALCALRDEWSALCDRSNTATIYQTWDWVDAWWKAFGRGKSLRLLLVRDGDDLVGVAPLYASRHLGTPLRRLAFLGTGVSDYLDVIAAPGAEAEVIREVCRRLSSRDDYDGVDLQQLPAESALVRHLRGRVDQIATPPRDSQSGEMHACIEAGGGAGDYGLKGHRVAVRPIERCPYVALPDSWDAYQAGLGKRMRQNVGYYERLVRRELPDAGWSLCGSEDLQEALTALFRLHQRRWRSQMLPGVLGSAPIQRFHRDIAVRLQRQGLLRLHVARAGGTIVAALYCFRYRERYYYYLGGFEPSLGRFSLGTTLTAAAIRQAIEEGCTEFDFLRGHEAYKYRWKPCERENLQCLIASPSGWRSSAFLALNRVERYVEARAKAFSDRGKGLRAGRRGGPEGVSA